MSWNVKLILSVIMPIMNFIPMMVSSKAMPHKPVHAFS